RNWDYRFAWIRDSSFTVDTLLALACEDEASACFHWFAGAAEKTHPHLDAAYALTGSTDIDEAEIDLPGYRDSRPVRVGNGAAHQNQLGIYGDLMQTAFLIHDAGHEVDPEAAARLPELADHVCEIWSEPDAGIWEAR